MILDRARTMKFMLIFLALLLAMIFSSAIVPTSTRDVPASPAGYAACDWTNAPELCDPDDNPQDRVGEPLHIQH